MNSKWTLVALLFSVTVNVAVVGTLVYFWQHNNTRQFDVELQHLKDKDKHDLIWFGTPPVPPPTAKEIDSLRRDYHKKLVIIRKAIDQDRQEIISKLMMDTVNRDSVEIILKDLTEKQTDAERLTIDHLLEIKPLLPLEDWKFFIQDLRPRRTIQTKIIKLNDGDSTSILVDENEFDEIQIFDHNIGDDKKIIKIEPKNSKRRQP